MPDAIDTAKVTDRRTLRFITTDEMTVEAERIAAAERAGRLRRTGNWTAGQVFGHLATSSSFGYDGYPAELRPPWFIKLILRLRKGRYLRGPLPSGVKIPGIPGGTLGTQPLSLDDGLARLRAAAARAKAGPPKGRNVMFGAMTPEEWTAWFLRHAELHMSFLHPG